MFPHTAISFLETTCIIKEAKKKVQTVFNSGNFYFYLFTIDFKIK